MSLSSLTTSPGPKPFPPRSRPTSPPISQAHDEAQRYQRLFKLTEYQVLRLRIPTQKSAEGIWTRQGNRAGIRRQLEPEIDCGPPIRTKAMDPLRVVIDLGKERLELEQVRGSATYWINRFGDFVGFLSASFQHKSGSVIIFVNTDSDRAGLMGEIGCSNRFETDEQKARVVVALRDEWDREEAIFPPF